MRTFPLLSAFATCIYENTVLLHLWPLFQSSIDEAFAPQVVPTPSSHRTHAASTRRSNTNPSLNRSSWQGFLQFSISLCYSLAGASGLCFRLGLPLIVNSPPLVKLVGFLAVAIAADGILNAPIILCFLYCIRDSRKRWSSDRVVLSKFLNEVMSAFIRSTLMTLICGALAQTKSTAPRTLLSYVDESLPDTSESETPSIPWWCLTAPAVSAVLISLHTVYVIRKAIYLMPGTRSPTRRDSDIELAIRDKPAASGSNDPRRLRRPHLRSTPHADIEYPATFARYITADPLVYGETSSSRRTEWGASGNRENKASQDVSPSDSSSDETSSPVSTSNSSGVTSA